MGRAARKSSKKTKINYDDDKHKDEDQISVNEDKQEENEVPSNGTSSRRASRKTENNVEESSNDRSSRRAPKRSPDNNTEENEPLKKSRETRESNNKDKTKVNADKEKSTREYVVEAIVGQRKNKGGDEFLIKWKGYGEKQNTWEPKSNLNCSRLLNEFLKNKK